MYKDVNSSAGLLLFELSSSSMLRALLRPRVERFLGVFLSFTGAVFILKEFELFEEFRVLRREPLRVGMLDNSQLRSQL